MGFSRGAAGLALALSIEAAIIAALVFAGIYGAVFHHLYATALVTAGIAALIGLDMAHRVVVADRVLAQFLDGALTDGSQRPTSAGLGLVALEQSMGRALERVSYVNAERQRRIDYLSGLADTVAAALFVCDEAGKVEYANLAGRAAFGALADISGLGPEQGARLRGMPLGAGEVMRMADGRPMLALALGFATPGGGRRRLVSLQRIAGELDAVELKAWQDLVRVLSHEMMNSLTPICSLAESCADTLASADPSAADALRIIARRSEGLIDFVGRYRQVFELPAPQPEAIRLLTLLHEVETLMRPEFTSAGALLHTHVEPEGLSLPADRGLLEQAILNLVKNALEAVGSVPGGAVSLSAVREDDRLRISISDNGPGLSPDDVEAVFIPFFSRKAGGSGIGLSLARQIALAHNGRVDYAPNLPRGATFSLVLPRR